MHGRVGGPTTDGDLGSPDLRDSGVQVETVRGFNRFYSTVLAGLNEHLVNTEFSLTEVRVLFALYNASTANSSKLRDELRLDAGYLSRILRRFEHDSIIERSRSDVDGRRQDLSLTEYGRNRTHQLYMRADDVLVELLSHLDPDERCDLISAMATIKGILGRHGEPWRPFVP